MSSLVRISALYPSAFGRDAPVVLLRAFGFHVSPAGSPHSHVMALSPLFANRRGDQGSMWHQRADWLRIVDGLFRDSYDSLQTLRNSPPPWIVRPTLRLGDIGHLPPGVADYSVPPDEFATLQQYRDALSSL
jgi:hypothetical protein